MPCILYIPFEKYFQIGGNLQRLRNVTPHSKNFKTRFVACPRASSLTFVTLHHLVLAIFSSPVRTRHSFYPVSIQIARSNKHKFIWRTVFNYHMIDWILWRRIPMIMIYTMQHSFELFSFFMNGKINCLNKFQFCSRIVPVIFQEFKWTKLNRSNKLLINIWRVLLTINLGDSILLVYT